MLSSRASIWLTKESASGVKLSYCSLNRPLMMSATATLSWMGLSVSRNRSRTALRKARTTCSSYTFLHGRYVFLSSGCSSGTARWDSSHFRLSHGKNGRTPRRLVFGKTLSASCRILSCYINRCLLLQLPVPFQTGPRQRLPDDGSGQNTEELRLCCPGLHVSGNPM